jgi:hypothetical protein
VLHFPLSRGTGEICLCWNDEIGALAQCVFLLHPELFLLQLESSQWKLEDG